MTSRGPWRARALRLKVLHVSQLMVSHRWTKVEKVPHNVVTYRTHKQTNTV